MNSTLDPLMVVTSYFNPCRYQTRRRNYDRFIAGLRSNNVDCLTIECAFPNQNFELAESLDVIHIRAESLVWQKDRLLNLAVSWLPPSVQYVAWLDCDILFANRNWGRDLIRVLQSHPIAQVFETCRRLSGDGSTEVDSTARSFASVMASEPHALECGRYDLHGHTGYGWAMRRDIFDEVGLYEAAISGSADHFMAHAIYGHYGFCINNALKHDPRQIAHLKAWGKRFHNKVQGKLGVVPGTIDHLWHGDATDRRYFLRMHDITDLGYDPYTDVVAAPGRPIEWAPTMQKTGLKSYFTNYFESRREDGVVTN